MTIYILSFLFWMNSAQAVEIPYKKIILLKLSKQLVSQNKTIYPIILNLNACGGTNPSLQNCYLLFSQLNKLAEFKKNQLSDVKKHIDSLCFKKILKIYTLKQLIKLKNGISDVFCHSLISKRIELIKYKSVDPQQESI